MKTDMLFKPGEFDEKMLQYPMLKLVRDIANKYPVKLVTPFYHLFLTPDNKQALDGYHIEFNNEMILSIQFGWGNYCYNRNYKLFSVPQNQFVFLENCNNAEIAIIGNDGLIKIKEWGDSVLGYQTPDEIMQVIEKYIYPNN